MILIPLYEARTTDVERLAKEFSSILRSWLSKEELSKVVKDNEEEKDSSICHSHDHCDPNQAMIDAFTKIKGKDIDFQDDKNMDLMNKAWDLAKKEKFYSKQD